MMRILFVVVLLFLLSAAIGAAYVRLSGKDWDAMPWAWVAVGGLLLTAGMLFWFEPAGAPAGSHYTPAKVVDDHLVPGQMH